jgi:hypothetical protein
MKTSKKPAKVAKTTKVIKTKKTTKKDKFELTKNLGLIVDGAQDVLKDTGEAITSSAKTVGEGFSEATHNATEGFKFGALGATKFIEKAMKGLRSKLEPKAKISKIKSKTKLVTSSKPKPKKK